MVSEAEKFSAEDEATKQRVEARNSLECYVFSLKSSLSDKTFAEKINAENTENLHAKIAEVIQWIGHNPNAETSEFASKQSNLEELVASSSKDSPGKKAAQPQTSPGEAKVDEID